MYVLKIYVEKNVQSVAHDSWSWFMTQFMTHDLGSWFMILVIELISVIECINLCVWQCFYYIFHPSSGTAWKLKESGVFTPILKLLTNKFTQSYLFQKLTQPIYICVSWYCKLDSVSDFNEWWLLFFYNC